MVQSVKEKIVGYIRAGYPGMWLQTAEEARAERLVREAAAAIGDIQGQDALKVYCWSLTEGFHGCPNGMNGEAPGKPGGALSALKSTEGKHIPEDSVVVLKDFHPFFQDEGITRTVRDLLASAKQRGQFIVFVSPVLSADPQRANLRPEIEKDLVVLELPLPDADEFGLILTDLLDGSPKLKAQGAKVFGVSRESVLDGLSGLTATEGENVLSLTIVRHGAFTPDALKTIHREKALALKKSGLLRYKETDKTVDDVGGLDVLKEWFKSRMVGFTKEAREAGMPYPKGVLLVGVQGCGKSLAAEAVAAMFQVPLIEGSIGDVMDGLVGGSERKMREMLATADAIGKCVLRLDEFEKMAAGMESSGRTDGGTVSRVLKDFLTWLNDRKSPVFVVATVNRLDALPAEIVRKGRFDDIFFVDLPNAGERQEIVRIHLKRNRQDPEQFAVDKLAEATAGFSGAEIEQAIIGARFRSFSAKRGLTTQDILNDVTGTKPLSVTMKEQIDAVRERLKHVAKAASSPDPKVTASLSAAQMGGRKIRG